MLTLSHIRKDYGKFTAVEDINLELENGLYAMLAPNGAGKTTLINPDPPERVNTPLRRAETITNRFPFI